MGSKRIVDQIVAAQPGGAWIRQRANKGRGLPQQKSPDLTALRAVLGLLSWQAASQRKTNHQGILLMGFNLHPVSIAPFQTG